MATRELPPRLIYIYSKLDDASVDATRDELVKVITDRVISLIQSSVAGLRGKSAMGAAREAVRLSASCRTSIPPAFDLAVHEHLKERQSSAPPMVSRRRKQDKFGILDSTSHYESDFKASIGALGASVIYFDLDGFKQINTRFTETVVDRSLLPELQRLILALVSGRGFAYAEGGDEFVITLPNTNAALAEAFTSVLLEHVRSKTFLIGDIPVKVTASAGIASSTVADGAQVCRDAANVAKRDAKDAGKDRYVVSGQLA